MPSVEAETVIAEPGKHGLRRGESRIELYVMCEIPNNVIQTNEFARVFDGFSIGSNDLTQLTLDVERDPGTLELFRLAIVGAHCSRRQVRICAEAPASYPEIARFLAAPGIESISVNPSSLLCIFAAVREVEAAAAHHPAAAVQEGGPPMVRDNAPVRTVLRDLFDRAAALADPRKVLAVYLAPKPKGRRMVVGMGNSATVTAATRENTWGHERP